MIDVNANTTIGSTAEFITIKITANEITKVHATGYFKEELQDLLYQVSALTVKQ